MPTYLYKAKEGPEKIILGTVDSGNRDSAIREIIGRGLTPLEVVQGAAASLEEKHETGGPPLLSFRRIPFAVLISFTRQMSDLVDAAVPLLRSLEIVSRQTRHPLFKDMVDGICAFVGNGGSFSQALAQYPQVFPSFYVHMVKAAEATGRLGKVLIRLADHLEEEQRIRDKVKSSLAYPLLILGAGVLTVVVLLTFVIPRLSVMFDDLNQELPWPTMILVKVSAIFARYWWLMAGGAAAVGVCGTRWLRLPRRRMWFDRFQMKIPFLGDFLRIVAIGRLARTLGTLLENGVTVTAALDTAGPALDNAVLRDEVEKIAREVSGGSTLKAAFQRSPLFPPAAADMVAVGEEVGRLEQGLYKLAETLERQADQTVKILLSLLGPVVLIVVVAIVGFAVIAMLLPIFQMNLLIQ